MNKHMPLRKNGSAPMSENKSNITPARSHRKVRQTFFYCFFTWDIYLPFSDFFYLPNQSPKKSIRFREVMDIHLYVHYYIYIFVQYIKLLDYRTFNIVTILCYILLLHDLYATYDLLYSTFYISIVSINWHITCL